MFCSFVILDLPLKLQTDGSNYSIFYSFIISIGIPTRNESTNVTAFEPRLLQTASIASNIGSDNNQNLVFGFNEDICQ